MRLVIDLQGAQGASRLRGIGRYSRELALAMVRQPGAHEVVVALNANLPSDDLVAALEPLLPPGALRFWHSPGHTAEVDASATGRRMAGALLRAEFLASLRPDLLHVSSLFEGTSDDVVTWWPNSLERLPTVATCYDLIPLIRRADYLDGPWKDGPVSRWYFRQLREMQLCDGLLAISESSRGEAIEHAGFRADRAFNIRAGIGPLFAPRPLDAKAAAALHARYGLRPGFILFVGGGDLRKNEAGLIRAYGLLPEALRQAHQLVIVGKTEPDVLTRSAQAAAVPLAQIALVHFVEEADLPALYSCCAVSVLPSLHEGFGLPAAEAMACGAPTLASNNSSLPEVLGRADALFDATDPADMAARLLAVLSDPVFSADLAAHGLRQAATFTWEESARRAWQALEQVHTDLPPRRRSGPPRRLPRLAFVSPLPPQETGIASYSAELLPALARLYDITLVCDTGATTEQPLGSALPAMTPAEFLDAAPGFDRVLYQIGNSHFHVGQIEQLLPAAPGVVTLHDAFLSGALHWRAWQSGEPAGFLLTLLDSHGWPAVALANRKGLEAAVSQFPCALPVLRAALGLVQHSAHAKDILAVHYGPGLAGRSQLIPLLRRATPLATRQAARQALGVSADTFLVCSFGIVARTKLPELIMATVAKLAGTAPEARLVFVGEPLHEVLGLFPGEADAAAARATGRVDDATYELWLAAADLAVQLRADSRGETSKAVADCMAAGLPLVVNAYGSMAELPDAVAVKLSPGITETELTATLLRLHADPAARATLAAAARHHVATALDPDTIAAQYRDAIEAAYEAADDNLARRVVRGAAPHLRDEAVDLAGTARAISATFPAPRPPQLLLACGDMTKLSPQLAGLVRQCLLDHAPWQRVLPVAAAEDQLAQDIAGACALLGIPALPVMGSTVEAGSGDVLVMLHPTALPPATLAAARRRGVRLLPFGAPEAESAATLLALLQER